MLTDCAMPYAPPGGLKVGEVEIGKALDPLFKTHVRIFWLELSVPAPPVNPA
jgi:hypothetical protein